MEVEGQRCKGMTEFKRKVKEKGNDITIRDGDARNERTEDGMSKYWNSWKRKSE